MGEQIIFRYTLADAWGNMLAKIEVVDEKKNNVRCVYPCVSDYVKDNAPLGKIVTLDDIKLERIKNILLKHIDIFEIREVEIPFVIDGYINIFYFSIAGLVTEIKAFNISVYREEESKAAKKLLEVFDEIIEIFVMEGIERMYYNLELEI